jgi:uncharacterized protein (TIGR02284 family)
MATMVGKEKDLAKLLCDLITLDLDAIEAYEAAIARLSTVIDRDQLGRFMEDHKRHVQDLSALVRSFGEEPPDEADFKRILTKGKVVLASLVDDETILRAMKSNEDDTNQAYERATARLDIPQGILVVLRTNLADERRHRAWIEQRLDAMKAAQTHL